MASSDIHLLGVYHLLPPVSQSLAPSLDLLTLCSMYLKQPLLAKQRALLDLHGLQQSEFSVAEHGRQRLCRQTPASGGREA